MNAAGLRAASLPLILLLLAGCGSAPKKQGFDYGPLVASDPRSLLVVARSYSSPRSPARRVVLSTITQALAERGYYVLPARMSESLAAQPGSDYRFATPLWKVESTRRKLQQEASREPGLASVEKLVYSKAQEKKIIEKQKRDRQKAIDELERLEASWRQELIEDQTAEIAAFFGADAVMFVDLLDWSDRVAEESGLLEYNPTRTHSVRLHYHLKGNQGLTLWRAEQGMRITIKGGSGVIEKIWKTFANKSGDEIKAQLVRETHRRVIENRKQEIGGHMYSGVAPMLVGPYHSFYEKDRARRRGVN
ncbi:MAG: DUF799 family lipoprotein [Gammaproteobacteria bacterium]|nr:DUF799 family lipoprotein [Gammaproteobacteria bacterium]